MKQQKEFPIRRIVSKLAAAKVVLPILIVPIAFVPMPGDRCPLRLTGPTVPVPLRVAAEATVTVPGPVAVVYNLNVRKKLEWAIGWQCLGDTGNITYRDEHRVAITQK